MSTDPMTRRLAAECAAPAFEQRYRDSFDPWNFAHSTYERERYRALLAALPRARYVAAYEPGCSVGELTAGLAARCEKVLATDFAPSAVERARRRCAEFHHVDIHCADVAHDASHETFDLIVFSEIGYYFSLPQLRDIGDGLARRLNPQGDFIAAHWLGDSADHRLHGDAVHAQLLATLPLQWLRGERHAGFRIDVWRRA